MNPILKQIAESASNDIFDLITDGEKEILEAIHKMQKEAQLQETAPKFCLGFKISVDFDKSNFECALSWSVKNTLSAEHKIEDQNQPKLEFLEQN